MTRILGYAMAMLGALLLGGSVVAAEPPVPAGDSIMEWLRAAGFPTWAVVLLVIGNRLIASLQSFFGTLNKHVVQAERRLARLEAVVFMGQRPGHFLRDEGDEG